VDAADTRFVVGRVSVAGHAFTVASIHAFTSTAARLYEDRQSRSMVERLQMNFDALRETCNDRFIIGGDFNSGRIAESLWPGYGHGAFWDRLEAAGFHSCPWSSTGEEVVTYRHPNGSFVGQADHILLDKTTATKGLRTTFVPSDGGDLSDHQPLVVEISLDEPL
jgi:endonuclease/exonuclease/phosphatase family metal-dependent hydrolase